MFQSVPTLYNLWVSSKPSSAKYTQWSCGKDCARSAHHFAFLKLPFVWMPIAVLGLVFLLGIEMGIAYALGYVDSSVFMMGAK